MRRFIIAVAISGPGWDDCGPYARAFTVDAEDAGQASQLAWEKARDLYCTGLMRGNRVSDVKVYSAGVFGFVEETAVSA